MEDEDDWSLEVFTFLCSLAIVEHYISSFGILNFLEGF